jgi:hypothetical protein
MSDPQDQPQIYLITPSEFDLSSYPAQLAACLDQTEVACVRLALGTKDETRIAKAADALREVTHARDVALVIETHILMVERLGLDGVHLAAGARAIKKVRKDLGDDAIIEREFVQQLDLSTLTEGIENTVILSLQDVYFAEITILWNDLTANSNELPAPTLTLAPNPSSGSFTIATAGITGERTIEIRDMSGRVIQSIKNNKDVTEVTLENVDSGNYFVYVHSDNGTAIEKLVVR